MEIRTRFAPSPTGYMHIGNLRTALYSYLVAKSQNGKFILRIEDTDQNRLVNDSVEVIFNTLKSSGLLWDEGPDIGGPYGPYVQSERTKRELYLRFATQLVNHDYAYFCFCPECKTDEDQYKEECNYQTGFGYNGHCRNLTADEVDDNLIKGKPFVIRQKVPRDTIIKYHDEVYGDLEFNSNNLDDQVLIKQDGYPTYNFANVVDDHLMHITHIVRGNEYLSSTPKYVLLYQALNWDIPKFIHLPLINGKDADGTISKLSKRHGAVSFQELIKLGYLPNAILNYIAFLGWNPKTGQEIFSLTDLVNNFKITQLNKAAAIFDYQKLDWFNSEYIKLLSDKEFYEYSKQIIPDIDSKCNFQFLIPYLKEKRLNKFADLVTELEFLWTDFTLNEDLISTYKNKKIEKDLIQNILTAIYNKILTVNILTVEFLENSLRNIAEQFNVKFGLVMWIFRIALSNRQNTIIGGYEIALALKYEVVQNRLFNALESFTNK